MKIPLKPLDLEHLMYIHQTTSSSRSCVLLMSLVMPTHLKCPWNYQQPLGKKKRLSIKEEQQSPKAELWKTLAMQLIQSNPHPLNEVDSHRKQRQASLEESAHLFVCTVADSILPCSTKDCTYKK